MSKALKLRGQGRRTVDVPTEAQVYAGGEKGTLVNSSKFGTFAHVGSVRVLEAEKTWH